MKTQPIKPLPSIKFVGFPPIKPLPSIKDCFNNNKKQTGMNENDLNFAQEKAKRCKYFSWSPLATALYCRLKGIELKSVIHGKEWTGKECFSCTKWRLKEEGEE